MAFLYGRAGRLTSQNGGFRPGQGAESTDASEENPVTRAPPVPDPDHGRKKLRGAATAAAAVAGFRAGTPVRQRKGHGTVPPALHVRSTDPARIGAPTRGPPDEAAPPERASPRALPARASAAVGGGAILMRPIVPFAVLHTIQPWEYGN